MSESVKLKRLPVDTNCEACGKELFFGTWAYYVAETEVAICIECGVKRGWTSKQRVKQLIKALELREDLKTLSKFRKIELQTLMGIKRKIEAYRLGERDLEIEKAIVKLMNTVQSYLRQCGTKEEAEALNKMFVIIRENQELQKEVREEMQSRLYLVDKEELKRKKKKQKTIV